MSIQGQDVYNQLKKFIADNSIVGTAAGVIIALATKDVITSLVSDIIIPLVIYYHAAAASSLEKEGR